MRVMGGSHVDNTKTPNDSQVNFFLSLSFLKQWILSLDTVRQDSSGSDWAPVCPICCCHVNESHLVTLSCWGQAVMWRSWNSKWSCIWFMKFLNKLKELPDLERTGWFRKHNASTKSSKRNPSLQICFEGCVSQTVWAGKQVSQCLICISTDTQNQPTTAPLNRTTERRSSAGIQCCLQTTLKGKILWCLDWLWGIVCTKKYLMKKQKIQD